MKMFLMALMLVGFAVATTPKSSFAGDPDPYAPKDLKIVKITYDTHQDAFFTFRARLNGWNHEDELLHSVCQGPNKAQLEAVLAAALKDKQLVSLKLAKGHINCIETVILHNN